MNFKVDENLPVELCDLLCGAGHESTTVLAEGLGGAPDRQLFSVCQAESRVLVTVDLDFANIQAFPPSKASGVLVLHLARQDKPFFLTVMQRLLPLLESEPLEQTLWIVEEDRVRIRKG